MQYNNPAHIESLIRTRFMILFIVKLLIAVYVFRTWLFASDGGFIDRFENDNKWHKDFCVCQVYTVFFAIMLALIVSELIITTNIVKHLIIVYIYFILQIHACTFLFLIKLV